MRFSDLERREYSLTGNSSLETWYDQVRTLPLETLSDGDLARALRQSIHPEHVLPLAVAKLEIDPLAGDYYDGQLFWAVAGTDIRLLRGASERICAIADRLISTATPAEGPSSEVEEDFRNSVTDELRRLAIEVKEKLAS